MEIISAIVFTVGQGLIFNIVLPVWHVINQIVGM